MYKIGFKGSKEKKIDCILYFKRKLEKENYKVFIIEENRKHPNFINLFSEKNINNPFSQKLILENQIYKEHFYERMKNLFNENELVLLCETVIERDLKKEELQEYNIIINVDTDNIEEKTKQILTEINNIPDKV